MKPSVSKGGKNSLANLAAFNSRALVPPVLRDVGKLAAGVASVSTSGGSATGNPRNKCALQPGHSLMDWVRLGASGKDLTGLGSRAGLLSVTPKELALHKSPSDAWLAVRGKVYNVTTYLPFHPGGPDELMKGAGRDATALFDEIHPWVNYEQILQKCLVGRLTIESDLTADAIFFEKPQPKAVQQSPKKPENVLPAPTTPTEEPPRNVNSPEPILLPRFDWIQKIDYITIIFYTGAFSNPIIEINQTGKDAVNILLTYGGNVFENEIVFFKEVQWPCRTKITYETGKIEIVLKKTQGAIWGNYGVLRQKSKATGTVTSEPKLKCLILNKDGVNYNSFLIELERIDRGKTIVPIGKHVKLFDLVQGEELSRSYTPVPSWFLRNIRSQPYATDSVCLVIKRYAEGNVSKAVCDREVGDIVTISKPLGSFKLQDIERRESFIIFAAGTGITPMLSIMLFLLERRIRKCQCLRLLFFNRTSEDILLHQELEQLQKDDARFKLQHVLSQPDESWTGLKGHVTRSLVENAISSQLEGTSYVQRDLYLMACGPTIFTTLTHQFLKDLDFSDNQIHLFVG